MKEIKEVLSLDRSFSPQEIILGNMVSDGVGKKNLYLLRALVLIAHKIITVNWLKPHPSTLDQWLQRLKSVNCMESVTANLQLKSESYVEIWTCVILYLAR